MPVYIEKKGDLVGYYHSGTTNDEKGKIELLSHGPWKAEMSNLSSKKHILGFPVNLQTAKHQISTFPNCAKEKKGKKNDNNPGSNADGEGDHVDLG